MILNRNLGLLHSVVPLKRRLVKVHCEDWLDAPEVKYHLSLRDLAYGAYLQNKTVVNWRIFCRCRNKAKSIKRKYKRNAHGLMFNDKNNKEIWSILNKNGVVSNTVNFENHDPNILNDVFSSNQTIDNNHFVDFDNISNNGFSFRSVDVFEMFETFNIIKSNAIAYDGISLKFLKLVMPIAGNFILYLVNTILTTSCFPSS